MENNNEVTYARSNSFKFHEPKNDQADRYQQIRTKAQELSILIDTICPKSREQSLAITNLEQAVMWANKSIAVNE